MNQLHKFQLLLLIIVLLSCNNKKKELGSIESFQKLKRQNGMAQVLNRISEERIVDDYSSTRYEYLQAPIKYYIENARQFDDIISETMTLNNASNSSSLFNHYQALQQGYKFLNQKMNDSFTYWKTDTVINAFMSMDKKKFISKYGNDIDSINTKLQLSFLQADAIWIERLFLEKIEFSFNPSGSTFEFMTTKGSSDKILYKRGEKMKLTASLVNFSHKEIKYALIDGKKVQPTNDEYPYSRKITEARGLHVFRFVVYITKNGKLEAYPVAVTYQVE